jgi:hypothetical protein
MTVISRCGRYRATVAPVDNGTVIVLARLTDKGRVIDRQYVAAWHVLSRTEYPVPFHVALDLAHDLIQSGDFE